ncbi:MAG: hypothetical protein AAGF97_06570, partial [Planctomycetota bacterium]
GSGGNGERGSAGGDGGGGAGGTVKLFGTSIEFTYDGNTTLVALKAARGVGTEDDTNSDEGDNGRILLGDNDGIPAIANTDISSGLVQRLSGPQAVNPFLGGNALNQTTPYIPNLSGGAQVYGLLEGVTTADIRGLDFDLQTLDDIETADADALVGVFRLDDGLAQIGLGDNPAAIEFPGYDWVVVANLTNLNLSFPSLGLGIHSNASATTDASGLAFDDLASSQAQELTALNAGGVWVTLVPEPGAGETLLIDAAINANDSAAGDVVNLDDVAIASNSVQFITSSRSLTSDIGAVAADIDFSGLTDIDIDPDGNIIAITETRDALLVINGRDYNLIQVIENQFDGFTRLEDLSGVHATENGDFVYVQVGDREIATLSRDETTGLLSYVDTQLIEPGVLLTPVDTFENVVLEKFIYSDLSDIVVGLFSFDFTDADGLERYSQARVFIADDVTGLLTPLDFDVFATVDGGKPLTAPRGERFADLDVDRFDAMYVLLDSEPGESGLLRAYFATQGGIDFDSEFGGTEIGGADKVVVQGDYIQVLSSSENYVTVFNTPPGDLDPLFVQKSVDGAAGVTGLTKPVASTMSEDFAYQLVLGQESNSLGVISADGSGALQQRFVNNSAGVTGLISPTDILPGAAGGEIVASSLGDENNRGGLTTFRTISAIGNPLVAYNTPDDAVETLTVLPQPFPDKEGVITSWQFQASPTSVIDLGSGRVRPVLLERNGDSWEITAVGAERRPDAFESNQLFDFGLEAGSTDTKGKYFGWYTTTGFFPGQGNEGGISYDTIGESIRLDLTSGSITGCISDLGTCDATFDTESNIVRTYSVRASFDILEEADAVRAQFDDIEDVTVSTAGGADIIRLLEAPGSDAAMLTINTGSSDDQVDVLDLATDTMISLGAGEDNVVIATTSNNDLTVHGGTESDFFDLVMVGTATDTILNGDEGDDTFLVAGVNLGVDTTTQIFGGSPTVVRGDVLNFNPGTNQVFPSDPPSDGDIGVDGAQYGFVDFNQIETINLNSGPLLTIATPNPVIDEGQELTLEVTIPNVNQNSGVSTVTWDFPEQSIVDTSNTTLTLSWSNLSTLYGIDNGDATFPVRVSATNDMGVTSTEIIQVTVNDVLPTLQVNNAPNVGVNEPFELEFLASDPGDDLISWSIDWGDGNQSGPFSQDITKVEHIYSEPAVYPLRVTYIHEDVPDPQPLTSSVTVDVNPNSIGFTVDSIREGDDLELFGNVVATPVAIRWDINDDGNFGDAVGLEPTLSWADLVSLGIEDSGDAYPITMQVDYGTGTLVEVERSLFIQNVAPTATFGPGALFPTDGIDEGVDSAGLYELEFSNPTDVAPDDVTAGFTYSFDIGDNGYFEYVDQASPTVLIPEYWATESGLQELDQSIYTDGLIPVRGIIKDKDGGVREYVTEFMINDVAPEIDLIGLDMANEGAEYMLTLLGDDPGTETFIEYEIDWGDGTDVVEVPAPNNLSTAMFTHRFADNTSGDVVVTVTARDQQGTYSKTQTVSVANVAPVLSNLVATSVDDDATSVEGTLMKLTGTITDPGTQDDFTLNITWDDGTTSETSLDAGQTTFEVVHEYANDGTYEISISVTDKDNASDADSTMFTVTNAAPTVSFELSTDSTLEGAQVNLTGTIEDLGVGDTHTATVAWGDGTVEPLTISLGAFSATYAYDDDFPLGTAADDFTITVTATDANDPTSVGSMMDDITVNNRVPEITSISTTASTIPTAVAANDTVTLNATFQDFSSVEDFTAVIVWGDGTITSDPTITYDRMTLEGTVTATHQYAVEGIYEPSLVITDDDLGDSLESLSLALVGTFSNEAPMMNDQTFSIDENSAVGTTVGNIVANDDPSDELTYSIELQNEFVIDEETGEITLA